MIDKLPDPAISEVATYLGPPLMVGHVCSVQYSHTVPYNRFILLKKSTTEKSKQKIRQLCLHVLLVFHKETLYLLIINVHLYAIDI